MRVYDIAHSRTGDKGNISTISACAYRQEDYAVLAEKLTAEKVMEQFAPLGVTHVDRYEIPTLYALNFVIFGSLGGGVTRSLALDKHGKSLCGLPTDIVTTAGIAPLGKVSASLLVVGVGTTMNTKELIRQWKTVIASFCCCAAGVLLIVFVGRFIIGTDAAIAGAPIFAGASVALMIVNEALENVGLTDTLGVVVILIFALQKFIGVPLCSFCLNREARAFLKDREKMQKYLAVTTEDAASEKKRPLSFFSKTNKPVYNFTKVALVASLSTALSALTQDKINVYIICLVMGVLFTELGFLPRNALSKLDSYFLLLFSILMTIFSSLAKVTPQTLVQSFIPVLVVLLLGARRSTRIPSGQRWMRVLPF